MSGPNHSFNVNLAESYGIECAIMIHHFQFWITYNRNMKKNFRDGRTWTYNTLEEIAGYFPYWNKDKVFRIIRRLEEFGVIIKGNFNKTQFEKTMWYAFQNEEMFIVLQNCKIEDADSQNRDHESATSTTDTIPYTEPNNCSVLSKPETTGIVEKCKKRSPDGKEFTISFQDLMTACVQEKNDFSITEIEAAWNILVKYRGPVREWFKFISGTINNMRIKKQKTLPKGKKPWKKDSVPSAALKPPKKTSSEKDTSVLTFQEFLEKNGIKKPY